jgi:hypothetical protein
LIVKIKRAIVCLEPVVVSPLPSPAPIHADYAMPTVPISFEFFPPKTDALADQLWQALQQLKQLNPAFVSVTYGAGGSTRQRTQELVARICSGRGVPEAAAHLTCVGASRDEIAEVVEAFWQVGVRHIVALRGDAPKMLIQRRAAINRTHRVMPMPPIWWRACGNSIPLRSAWRPIPKPTQRRSARRPIWTI